jgi:hypothetical protein
MMVLARVYLQFFSLIALLIGVSASSNLIAASVVDTVSNNEMSEIRRAFRETGLHQADLAKGEDGRITLIGEYENRDEVEKAFAVARAIVGLSRVAPTTPGDIKYRLKNFDNAFSNVVGKMMQKPSTQDASAAAKKNVKVNERKGPITLGLLIGVGKYKNLPKENGLEGADKDAIDFYNFLVKKDGGAIPKENLNLLTQENATSIAVKAAMHGIVENTQKGDTVVLFAASHGLPNAMNKFDIVLHDTEFPKQTIGPKSKPFEFVITNRKTALSDDDLQEFIALLTLKDVRTVIVLDTCYSGKTFVSVPGYLPTRTRSLKQHKTETEYTTSMSQEAIADLSQKSKNLSTSRIVIVSASENEESLESPQLGGGAFTQTYIIALRNIRDFADAFDQTKTSVIKIARTMGHSQTPRMLVVPEQANTKM